VKEHPTPQVCLTDDEPKCGKCGYEITTGLMAVFCPEGSACEFWPNDCSDAVKVTTYELWEQQVKANLAVVREGVKVMRNALTMIRDESFSGCAYDWAKQALEDVEALQAGSGRLTPQSESAPSVPLGLLDLCKRCRETAVNAMLNAAPSVESATPRKGWAIRNTDGRWRTMDTIGMPDYTDDEAKALVCRLREHIERYAEDDLDDIRIVEVAW
jgi:hypothetical protein